MEMRFNRLQNRKSSIKVCEKNRMLSELGVFLQLIVVKNGTVPLSAIY